ncbi:MAG: hypothetical protein AAB268_13600 [Elusimicrobiota bacterium]
MKALLNALFTAGLLVFCAAAASADAWQAARPAYRGVENLADGVYSLIRGHLFTVLLPDRLSGRMSDIPADSSDNIFAQNLEKYHRRSRSIIFEARPMGQASSPAALDKWRNLALRVEMEATTDALAGTLVQRYQLARFGQDSGSYILNPSNWDVEFMASATVLGATYLYFAGLRTDWRTGPLRVDLDVPTGPSLRTVAGSNEGHLANLSFSRSNSPFSLRSAWGLHCGHFGPESLGVVYSSRF